MNQVSLIGRLTKDPELQRTPNDLSVCKFTIAVNRIFSSNKNADFINCVAWRTQAENLCKYQRKGNMIGVVGSIQTGSYDGKDGVRRYTTEVVANQIHFLVRDKQETQSEQTYTPDYYTNPSKSQQTDKQPEDFIQQKSIENENNSNPCINDDDLPF